VKRHLEAGAVMEMQFQRSLDKAPRSARIEFLDKITEVWEPTKVETSRDMGWAKEWGRARPRIKLERPVVRAMARWDGAERTRTSSRGMPVHVENADIATEVTIEVKLE